MSNRLGLASLILLSVSAVQAAAQITTPPAGSCSVSQLVPKFAAPSNGFNGTAGTAIPIDVTVADDCGNTITNATVTVKFSSGAPSVTLTATSGGHYTGTWTPSGSSTNFMNAIVTATAPYSVLTPFGTKNETLSGTATLTGSVGGDTTVPLVFTGGVLSAVSFDPTGYVVPGGYVAIFGRGLADALAQASSLPLTTTLGGVSVTLNGEPLYLNFVSPGQINAIVPFDTPTFGNGTLTVTRNGKASNTVTVPLLAADPAVISRDSTGTGQGTVVNGTTGAFADASNPVTAGDVIVIYLTGLGVTSPAITAGASVPTDQLYPTAAKVNVLIGGVQATVFYAGATPGFAGLYQINAYVPPGTTTGSAVPVIVREDVGSIAERISPAVTIAVK